MSLDASGTVGGTTVFSKWKGRNYVRLRVTPKNLQSNDQAKVRTILGLLGKALSFVGYPTMAHPTTSSALYKAAILNAPAGQSWISYSIKQLIGTAQSTWDSVSTAWGLLTTVAALFETGGSNVGLADFSLSYGTFGTITKGEQLYHIATFAVGSLGCTSFPDGVNSATAPQIAAFVIYMQTLA